MLEEDGYKTIEEDLDPLVKKKTTNRNAIFY